MRKCKLNWVHYINDGFPKHCVSANLLCELKCGRTGNFLLLGFPSENFLLRMGASLSLKRFLEYKTSDGAGLGHLQPSVNVDQARRLTSESLVG